VTIGGRCRYRLQVGDPDALGVSLVKAPQLSLIMLLTSRSPSSAIQRTARSARAAVQPSNRFAVVPMLASAGCAFPDVATPIPPTADVSVGEQVQRLHDLSDDAVVDDLTYTYGPELPTWWRPAADRPRRWLDSYASATVDAWSAVSPRWRQAQSLLDLEARRVGAAVVRGCIDVLLNALHPRMRYENGEFSVPYTHEVTVELGTRQLVLVPTVAGPLGRLVGFDLPDVAYVAYPVPGQEGGDENGTGTIGSDGDPLSQVLGWIRADLLRAAGGSPITMGQLAAAMGCSPRMTSYHCGRLEAAGLIVRERKGQSVWVSRTARGHELVELLSA
jgi:DNA-binding transcriptional ArsR family regulator